MKPNILLIVITILGKIKLNEKNKVRRLKKSVTVKIEYFPPEESNTSSAIDCDASKHLNLIKLIYKH